VTKANRGGIRFDKGKTPREKTGHLLSVCTIHRAEFLFQDPLFPLHDKRVVKEECQDYHGQDDKVLGDHANAERAYEAKYIEGVADNGIRPFHDNPVLFVATDVEAAPYPAESGKDNEDESQAIKNVPAKA